jgi:hypothetical protein
MYFGLVIIIAGSVAIYRMAEQEEGMRAILWGALAFTLSFAAASVIPRPFLGPIAGLLVCYVLMVGVTLSRA